MGNEVILTKIYEGKEVAFRINKTTGESEVRINEISKFCGWTEIAKSGNECIKWSRVREKLSILDIDNIVDGDFIPESLMYPLIGMADLKKNKKAREFMLWVGQILTQLRTKGVVILENANDGAIDFEKKFGKYRIRKTFTNSKNEVEDYKQFKKLSKEEWKSKRLNNIERVKLSNIIVSALENKINSNVLELKPSRIIGIQEVVNDVKTDIVKLSNKKNGGDKAVQTKLIKELQEQLENSISIPQDWEYITLDTHGFSNNYMYRFAEGHTYKTTSYNSWISHFPIEDVPEIDYWEDVDFTKPIEVFINYVAKSDMDIRNFDKSFIDMIFNRIYEIDDNIVEGVHSQRVGVCDAYNDGKISFCIRNL